jgi:transcription-repair coupling factor (superfamily II helicase)
VLSGAPEGYDALVVADVAGSGADVLHVARDDQRRVRIAEAISFFAPQLEVLHFPAWDCLPYDRVSPNSEIESVRTATLSRLARRKEKGGLVLVTTVNALLQRVPARASFAGASFETRAGAALDLDELTAFLVRNGYQRTDTVREPGEFALRGGIVDLFPPGAPEPVRLDLFGDKLERIRGFDPVTQISVHDLPSLSLGPVSEVFLDPESIARFRSAYRQLPGATAEDPVYVAISEGRKHIGMEHYLPLFHERLENLFDYLPEAVVTLDHQAEEARDARFETIADYYEARRSFQPERGSGGDTAPAYRPIEPRLLYLSDREWDRRLDSRAVGEFTPFALPPSDERRSVDLGGRRMESFAATSAATSNVYDTVRAYLAREAKPGRRLAVAAYSAGSRDRLGNLLAEHGVAGVQPAESWEEAQRLSADAVALVVLGIEHGFNTPDLVVIGEQDILGERLVRRQRRRRRAEEIIADASELSPGDFVVHVDHGIGRYEGLETITAMGAPHDCFRLTYADGDRLFVPVENIEVLSRYASAEATAALDKLGGQAWQSRKARLKRRLRDMAEALIKVAAERALKAAPVIVAPPGTYDEFVARFPFTETDDQLQAIDDTMIDLTLGRAMDRLVCGDVGFGKTEVAMRAAYATVLSGGQVAVVVPTTLLARQHFETFSARFAGLSVKIGRLSRLVTAKEAAATKAGIKDGSIHMVVGTHALLAKDIAFRNLALLVIDEEQHFGVAHKERLKHLRASVHVLTLTATPIPRTLQQAMSGLREMSVIATPPVDRLAVRTFVLPYDPVVIREAIMRERFRGGQVFYVVPRIEDLPEISERLRRLVPEASVAVAHGQMPPRALEEVMNRFYNRERDILLSTQIIESGLDIPTVNTMIVHRADMFGLAQLYQLRGRIGRSKLRAYCYLTLQPKKTLTVAAERRLHVLQTLDTLGAGFSLASHDLDIRGAGNLLGEEQSGHIREVGVELYQHMLEEAVAAARGGVAEAADSWTPQINLGIPVLIPETYVSDLGLRLGLYRRLGEVAAREDVDAFAAELIDRFGALPQEAKNLLDVVTIKLYCRAAGIEKLDAGPRGASIVFRGNRFANPAGLVEMIQREGAGRAVLHPDHRLVLHREWHNPEARLKGALEMTAKLAEIAAVGG